MESDQRDDTKILDYQDYQESKNATEPPPKKSKTEMSEADAGMVEQRKVCT